MSDESTSTPVATRATFYVGETLSAAIGAANLRFWLIQGPDTDVVNGAATNSQAITPPNGYVNFPTVTGEVHSLGFGPAKILLHFQGQTVVSMHPPLIGSYPVRINASCVIDRKTGKGTCQWTMNNQRHSAPVSVKISQA